uniref:Defensin n=1 Tax=Acrobeloides nanus TaxID=290746 RepID=A0A914C2H2_9BILA
MKAQWLIRLFVFLLLLTIVSGLCANAGSNCHDTGCRLHGGQCNSACMCIQRKTLAEVMYGAGGGAHSHMSL